MDDFFDLEDATHAAHAVGGRRPFRPQDLPTTTMAPYDIDLILAQAVDDDNSFSSLQHFVDPMLEAASMTPHLSHEAAQVWEANSVQPISGWANTAERPPVPCVHCRHNGQECCVIRNPVTNRSGSCTSCVTLSRRCDLGDDPPHDTVHIMNRLHSASGWVNTGHNRQPVTHGSARRTSDVEHGNASPDAATPPNGIPAESGDGSSKTGARFSRETVRILRNWLSLHHRHPYPTEEEKEDLKRRTGLNQVQITNWLANARRRGQVKAPRAKSPATHAMSAPMRIPRRGQASSPFENMNPMERWRNSPPEHEPASVTAIAEAVNTASLPPNGSGVPAGYSRSNEGSLHSQLRASSISSRNTTPSSGGSFASAFSHHSRASFGSFGKRGRRRRRQIAKPLDHNASMVVRQYQCTFCVESFKTKHDWQRHEKSLHLSLERWVCAPQGNTMFCKTKKAIVCVFCGSEKPNDAHMETHNYTGCLERSLEERTFYRKDHLRQHLRLVHDSNLHASMDVWKIATPNVRSRCGFCNLNMDSWAARVDHLAEHFKAGKTMADWEGDWGFDAKVRKLVENYTLPHLIHKARNPEPADHPSSDESLGPYDMVKAGLLDFAQKQAALGIDVSDEELRVEACRIVYGYQAEFPSEIVVSWFREMIMCPSDDLWLGDLRQKAGLPGLKDKIVPQLDIDDKPGVEKFCELERQLTDYVSRQRALGLSPTDAELQTEGCRIVVDYDAQFSAVKDSTAATWFCKLIMSSTDWLQKFRARVGLPASTEMANVGSRPKDNATVDASIHNYQRLDVELAEYVSIQARSGRIPSDSDLQLQARLIIFGVDDNWNQTPADNEEWLQSFKQSHGLLVSSDSLHPSGYGTTPQSRKPSPSSRSHSSHPYAEGSPSSIHSHVSNVVQQQTVSRAGHQSSSFTVRNSRCYRRYERLLANFVALCMSPTSPNPHVPTDQEIRAKAREIIQQDASPWNLSAVDNDEWLVRFKQSCGLISQDDGTLMPVAGQMLGGLPMMPGSDYTNIEHGPESYPYMVSTPPPEPTSSGPVGVVFSSLEMETALAKYFQDSIAQGFYPTDDALRTRARMISRAAHSEADDPILLDSFKQTYLKTKPGDFNFTHMSMPPTTTTTGTTGPSSTITTPYVNPNPMAHSMPWMPVLESSDPEAQLINQAINRMQALHEDLIRRDQILHVNMMGRNGMPVRTTTPGPENDAFRALPSISRDELEKRIQGGPVVSGAEGAW